MRRRRPLPTPVGPAVVSLGPATVAVLSVVAVLALAGCTASRPGSAPGSSGASGSASSSSSGTSGSSGSASGTPTASSPSSVAPVSEAPIAPAAAVSEVPADSCPYITDDDARNAEGDRVGRVTLTTTDPPGCNFYWQYDEARMIAQISVENYPTQAGARNAMIRTAQASAHPEDVDAMADFAPGVDAVWFRTTFYPPDGDTDWACSFAKNSRVITVRTQQNDTSQNARNFALAVVAKF